MYPVCDFEHLGEPFTTGTPVDPGHPMVALRPDLFTETKPPKKAKEAS